MLSIGMAVGMLPTPAAAIVGYDSAYQFESAFLTLNPGDSGTFSVFFANTGTTSWVKGTATQVNLATCLDDKVTCNVPPEEAAFASGWLSATAYATHTKDSVIPGDFSAFTYTIKAPATAAAATYRFNGDLVLGSTQAKVHPEGYYQDAKVSGATTGTGVITATPAFASANDAMNFVSDTVPGIGQHTVTFNAPSLAGTNLTFVLIASGNVALNADGSYSFCDTNQDNKADIQTSTATVFTAVNGTAIANANTIVNQAVPADGKLAITIDSATRNQRVRVIGWQDKTQNGQLELTAQGDVNCDAYTPYNAAVDGAIAVSGRKFYTGPAGTFGAQFPDSGGAATCNPVFRFSSTLNMFTSGPTGATSLRFIMDANDIFRVQGTPVTLAQFKSSLTSGSTGTGDKVTINYSPDPAGTSEFNICSNTGFLAPTDLAAAVGNFDNGTSAEDVRLTFTVPTFNTTTYPIQRSFLGSSVTASSSNCALGATPPQQSLPSGNTPADSTFATVGAVTQNANGFPGGGEQATFVNFDLGTGGYCFRVRTQDSQTGSFSYSNYVPVNVTTAAGDTRAPLSTSLVLSTSAGFANTLDQGDKFVIDFDEPMSFSSNAVIRFTDSDCGSALNTGPVACAGGTTNTVADVICGTNATCTANTQNTTLTVTLTGSPSVVAAGSTAGLQYPVVVTDTTGITDQSGNLWNFASTNASSDRLLTNP
ncbi:MAG: hypothetical protein HY071_03690 [Chloroflexi bacterium]|nr:hypothetical protein [Chloroflexota bacterium]